MNPRFRIFFIYLVMASLAISSATGMHLCMKTFALKKTKTALSHSNKEQAPAPNTTACGFSPLMVDKQEIAAKPAPAAAEKIFPMSVPFHAQHYFNPPFSPPRILSCSFSIKAR